MRHILFTLLSLSFSCQQAFGQWSFSEIGSGIKPSIHIGADDQIHIATIKEDQNNGFISYINITDGQITTENVANEYFYGPIDIKTDATNNPVICFHHHSVGDGELVVASLRPSGEWTLDVALHDGHDGWDGTLDIDQNGIIHTASIDPGNAAEYGQLNDGQWTIESIESAEFAYQYGTDIELDDSAQPLVTYFIVGESSLRYATKTVDTWTIEHIDSSAIYPSMVLTQSGPIIAYYKVVRDTSGNWANNGQIMIASKSNDTWSTELVANINNVSVGTNTGARSIVDLHIDNQGTRHIVFSNDKVVRYGTFDGTTWSISEIFDVEDQSYNNIGQLVSLDIDSSGIAHAVTYRRTSENDGIILYGNNSGASTQVSLMCPPDITISCEELITPVVTGSPLETIDFTSFDFRDTMLISCPSDTLVIQRSWIGFVNGTPIDTCIQLITVTIDPMDDFTIPDTLCINEVCVDQLDEVIQLDLNLPCNVGIDSIGFTGVKSSCDSIVIDAVWTFKNDCIDSSFIRPQTIIIKNRIAAKLDQTLITSDTGNESGSITLLPNCAFDSLSYEWSNGATDSLIRDISGGNYMVTITNQEGCADTLSFNVDGVMMDTMMMDTMMMDTMMMDTMMMDTMMMDTMMMDTMMMDTMMMDTMMMDTMMMDTMMMDTMMMDTMMMDTMMMDTMMMDTMMMDTMMMDTMMMDTMMMDTMMMDTMMMDTMMMDTMMMDTMMMDTMMMDTMMMDTMMMDTMMMDTVVKSTLSLRILDRNGQAFATDSIFFMNQDSTFRALPIDSSGAYMSDSTLSDIAGVCILKEGVAIDSLSVIDLTRGQRIIVGLDTSPCLEDIIALDTNNDEKLTAFDLVLMKTILLERRDGYPDGVVWKYLKRDGPEDNTISQGSCILINDKDRIRGSIDLMSIKIGDLKCADN